MPREAAAGPGRESGPSPAVPELYGHWGLVTGSMAGLLAGPFGSVAGLFLGLMLDIAIGERLSFLENERYLADPQSAAAPVREGLAGSALFMGIARAWASENDMDASLALDLAAGALKRIEGSIAPGSAMRQAADRCRLDSMDRLVAAFGRTALPELRDALPSVLYGLLALSRRKLDPERDSRIMGLCSRAMSRDDYGAARRACFPSFEDPWKALGIPEGSCQDEVRRAYRRQSRKLHPDAPGGNAERFIAVRRAYEELRGVAAAKGA